MKESRAQRVLEDVLSGELSLEQGAALGGLLAVAQKSIEASGGQELSASELGRKIREFVVAAAGTMGVEERT